MGGGLTKSAYYVIYISEKELQDTRPIDENSYEPSVNNFETQHPYGSIASQVILKKILEDNRKLMGEVDQFKGTEIAKKVTTLYELYYDQILKVMEQKIQNKDIGSIYSYFLNKQDTADLGKRLLIDQCFFKEVNQRVQNMERAQGILAKIEEKSKDKQAGWYPNGRMWLNDDDWRQIADGVKAF